MNRHTVIGRVGQDPSIHVFESGKKVAKFSFATSEKYKNSNGEKVEETDWHNVVFYSPIAEVIEKWVNKGDLLAIEGRSKTRDYTDKEGVKKYVTELVGRELEMLGSKSEAKPEVKAEVKTGSDPAELGAEFSDDNFVPPPTTEDNPFVS